MLYSGAALAVIAAVVFSDSKLLRPFTEPRTKTQRETAADRARDKEDADIAILFIGNSHVQSGAPVQRFIELFERDGRGETIYADIRAMGNAHMEDHLRHRSTLDAIDEGGWDYVVLQGQNYSASGRYEYPTDACVELGRRIAKTGAQVLLFPEWKQIGSDDEAIRVQALHEEIAPRIPARIVPVGLAWDRALALQPDLALHAADGNHSSHVGGYLTALVFYTAITDRDPRGLAAPDSLGISDAAIETLQTAAWQITSDSKSD